MHPHTQPSPPPPNPPPCRAERSAGHRRLGVFVREAISEGVLWLGWPRERPARCREGEYALVSSRFTKTAHPVCSHLPRRSGLHGQARAQIQPPHPPAIHPTAKKHACSDILLLFVTASHSAWHTVDAASKASAVSVFMTPRVPCLCFCPHPPAPKMLCRLGRIVKEAASRVVDKAALAQHCGPRGRPRTGTRDWGRRDSTSRPETGGA